MSHVVYCSFSEEFSPEIFIRIDKRPKMTETKSAPDQINGTDGPSENNAVSTNGVNGVNGVSSNQEDSKSEIKDAALVKRDHEDVDDDEDESPLGV